MTGSAIILLVWKSAGFWPHKGEGSNPHAKRASNLHPRDPGCVWIGSGNECGFDPLPPHKAKLRVGQTRMGHRFKYTILKLVSMMHRFPLR